MAEVDVARSIMMRVMKDQLQRQPYLMQAAIEQFIDDRGPSRYPSTRKHIGKQKGRLSAGLVPRSAENVTEIRVTSEGAELYYSTLVPYHVFHELGTRYLPVRKSFEPGIELYEKQYAQPLMEVVLNEVCAWIQQNIFDVVVP